jgi:hypothetical protein
MSASHVIFGDFGILLVRVGLLLIGGMLTDWKWPRRRKIFRIPHTI